MTYNVFSGTLNPSQSVSAKRCCAPSVNSALLIRSSCSSGLVDTSRRDPRLHPLHPYYETTFPVTIDGGLNRPDVPAVGQCTLSEH